MKKFPSKLDEKSISCGQKSRVLGILVLLYRINGEIAVKLNYFGCDDPVELTYLFWLGC